MSRRDLAQELRASFDHATMRAQAEAMRSTPQWKAVQEIQKRHDQARTVEAQEYRKSYDARVATERQKLLQKRGQLTHELKPPTATDRFSKSRLEQQAHKNVRFAHQQRMSGIDQSETRALKNLSAQTGPRQERPTAAQRQEAKQTTARPTQAFKQRM